jgi:cyanophycinase-like exopeptidase
MSERVQAPRVQAPDFVRRPAGDGWLALLGGGEFSFGETHEADVAWLAHTEPGPIGFVPAASGSLDYGHHFADYLEGEHGRLVEIVPIYRPRDARRGRNAERLAECAAIYLGGGVADHLLEALAGSPAADAALARLRAGGVVVAIAAAAQALGRAVRSIQVGRFVDGLDWLPGGVVETNFDPDHDRRLRQSLARPGVSWGLGIPSESAVLLGPGGAVEATGPFFAVAGADGELVEIEQPEPED